MNTNTTKQTHTDVIPDRQNVPLMIHAAWQLLKMGLFPCRCSIAERANGKAFIKAFITKSDNAYANYAGFCQRILMARHYITNSENYTLYCSISQWLDPSYRHGFTGTAKWFEKLKENRKIEPLHLLELKAFPEALLELAEETTPDIFQYWAGWFLEKKAPDLHLMFLLVACRLHFGYESIVPDLPIFSPLTGD